MTAQADFFRQGLRDDKSVSVFVFVFATRLLTKYLPLATLFFRVIDCPVLPFSFSFAVDLIFFVSPVRLEHDEKHGGILQEAW